MLGAKFGIEVRVGTKCRPWGLHLMQAQSLDIFSILCQILSKVARDTEDLSSSCVFEECLLKGTKSLQGLGVPAASVRPRL